VGDRGEEDAEERAATAAVRGRQGGPLPGSVRVLADEVWTAGAGRALQRMLAESAAPGGEASIALSGGDTPKPVYGWLAEARDPSWERVHVFFGDERCVPPDDPRSNYRMARETLLDPLGLHSGHVHRMEAEREDREAAAAAYGSLLPARLTVLMLGIGREGHTASLFPGSAALAERARRVVPVHTAATPPDRLTVTPPVLEAAVHVVVLARGVAKADAVARALEAPWAPELCPAQLARRGTWILDAAAASRLARSGTEPSP
jgi:6-phosphogluconolactonase